VDLRLRAGRDAFVPRAGAVRTRIGRRLGGPVVIGREGLQLRLPGAGCQRRARAQLTLHFWECWRVRAGDTEPASRTNTPAEVDPPAQQSCRVPSPVQP